MKTLKEITEQYVDLDYGWDDPKGEIYQNYSLETKNGQRFYASIKDETLLKILKEKAEEIGHSPAQKEIFWVWREYIRKRFGKWPYALEAAGLSRSAGKGGKALSEFRAEKAEYQMLLKEVREKAQKLCRIPHPKDLPTVSRKISKYADNWSQVILDAGIDESFFQKHAVYKVNNLEAIYLQDLEAIKELADVLQRPPLKSEVPQEIKERLTARCGSYRNVLYQLGMEPVKRRNSFSTVRTGDAGIETVKKHQRILQSCYYEVLNLDDQTRRDLEEIMRIWKAAGKAPSRKEVSPELRKRLQQSCGSWANALYQLERKDIKKHEEKNCKSVISVSAHGRNGHVHGCVGQQNNRVSVDHYDL